MKEKTKNTTTAIMKALRLPSTPTMQQVSQDLVCIQLQTLCVLSQGSARVRRVVRHMNSNQSCSTALYMRRLSTKRIQFNYHSVLYLIYHIPYVSTFIIKTYLSNTSMLMLCCYDNKCPSLTSFVNVTKIKVIFLSKLC